MTKQNLFEGVISFAAGVIFSIGLAIAGMTQPGKVIGFLDVAGNWDPSLAFVMGGAIAVYFTANHFVGKRAAPLVGTTFHLPTRRDLEPRLLLGAALFGIGWGLAGYCPGPALTSLGTGLATPLAFVGAMLTGMWGFDTLDRLRAQRASVATEAATR